MYTTDEKAQIHWRCRRGMLELDGFILGFFEHCFDQLSTQEQQDFVSLLECSDLELFYWLMQREQSPRPAHQALIEKIIAHKRQHASQM